MQQVGKNSQQEAKRLVQGKKNFVDSVKKKLTIRHNATKMQTWFCLLFFFLQKIKIPNNLRLDR